MWLPLTILSLSVHEWAHAWSAWKLGDDTAAREGRLTLNPLSHIDPIGTLLLPLLGIPFGWARPVPVNPARFRRGVSMARGMAITASAGPLSNLALAAASAVVFGLLLRFAPGLVELSSPGRFFLFSMVTLNVGLAVFNMLPLPPLDGSRVVAWLLPHRLRDQWHALEQFAPFLLLAVFWLGRSVVAGPIDAVTDAFLAVTRAIAS